MKLLVTGGMGFIGSNFVRYMLKSDLDVKVINLDILSYGSNPDNLKDFQSNPAYQFVKGDIRDVTLVKKLAVDVEAVVNFAAETHVDRSISNPRSFYETNVDGALGLLEVCRLRDLTLLQISTDEVYGSAGDDQTLTEQDKLNPSSPYAATKASADLMVNAYHKTYGSRTFITRSTNNFGSYQFPEKFIPKAIISAALERPIPIYGSGRQVRDWINVLDHCEALDVVLRRGRPGEIYNIAGGNQIENLQVAEMILHELSKPRTLLEHVKDRPGHDIRYSLDSTKINRELGWRPKHTFEESLKETVAWYLENESWWRPLISEKILSPLPWEKDW